MTGTIIELLIAAIVFVGGHVGVSSTPVRDDLIRRLGERAYLMLYSAVALILLAWLIRAYAAAPMIELWPLPPLLIVLPIVIMPLALLLAVGGYTQRNPTAVMQKRFLTVERPAPGVLAITRHPLMWGIGLWALTHLVVAGDLAGVIFFAALAILSLWGTRLIDQRKQRSWPAEDWQRFSSVTSNLPFAALLSSRTELRLSEIGWWRILLTGVLYIVFILLHDIVLGVPAVVDL